MARCGAAAGIPGVVRVRMLGGFWVSVGPRTIGEDRWRLKKAAALAKGAKGGW